MADLHTPRRSAMADTLDGSAIRYGQCWEDADVLLAGLDIQPGDSCLSIASAGDNTLAMLTRSPGCVIALDFNPAQLACLELRVAAFRCLTHAELLELMGSTPSARRRELYHRARVALSPPARRFWDAKPAVIERGIGSAGRFERYLSLFRRFVLPLVHRRPAVERLLRGGTRAERYTFYGDRWNTWRWRAIFRLFFSRWVMGHLGRDRRLFQYVDGEVAGHLLARTQHALTGLNPAENPYVQWILTGRHETALPLALRPESFEPIRANLDRLEWHCVSIEEFLESAGPRTIDRFNLSDIFEYMSQGSYERLLRLLVRAGRPGGRLSYWNMLVPRSRPESMADALRPLRDLADELHRADKAFFYRTFVLEELIA